MAKTIKIGIYLPVYGGWLRGVEEEENLPTYDYVKKVAIEAEKIGIDSLWIPDHLLNPIKGERSPCLEAWTVAAAIVEATDRIISHTTLCEAFRYPAVLAKQAATLAEISKGRFLLSIGAGWLMGRCSVEEVRKNVEDMKERLRKRGRGRIEFAIPAFTFIRETDEEARRYVVRLVRDKRGLAKRIMDTGLVGSPETVAKRIRLLERVGIDHVLLQLTPTLKELQRVNEVLNILRKT